jgi:hypothetical protein
MLENRRGAALGLAFFLGLGAFGIWTEMSSQHKLEAQAPHSSREKAKTEVDPRTSEERIADYTLWLERFTGLLALVSFVQIAFLLRADKMTRIAAGAAEKAANAAIAQSVEMGKMTDLAEKQMLLAGRQADITEKQHGLARHQFFVLHRPRIRIAYIKIGPLQAGLHPTAEIWAINVGDSDAQIVEMGADIFPRRIGVAGLAIIGAAATPYPDVSRVPPGQQATLQVRGGLPLTQQTIDGIHGKPVPGVAIGVVRTTELCAVGTLHYLDNNGTRRFTSFFRIYNPARLRFMRARKNDEYAEWDYEA